jgi:NTE family protein
MNKHADISEMAATEAEAEVRTSTRGKRTLNLALQGGGAHGAFTWGVLDRLLEED